MQEVNEMCDGAQVVGAAHVGHVVANKWVHHD